MGCKVDAEWGILFDGVIFTIYNYKDGINYLGEVEGIPTQFITDWHLGGNDKEKGKEFAQFILDNRPGAKPLPKVTEEQLDTLVGKVKELGYVQFSQIEQFVDRFAGS